MSGKGRPRVPTSLHIIRGTFRKDRAPAHEADPTPVLKVPAPPSGLPAAGRGMWKRLAAELVTKGLLTVVDLEALEVLCMQYGMARELWKAIRARVGRCPECKTMLVETIDGWYCEECGKKLTEKKVGKIRRRTLAEYLAGQNSQTTPELTAMQKAYQTFKAYLTEFGLTPASRSRIDVPVGPEKPTEDPMERLDRAE